MVDYILSLSPGLLVLSIIILFIGLVSQIALYAKAGKPGLSALVPVWNVVVFVELVGRPKWHTIWIMLPGAIIAGTFIYYFPLIDGLFPVFETTEDGGVWIAGSTSWNQLTVPLVICGAALVPMLVFIARIFTEICDSFGKHTMRDKILCILLNGVYILFVIGISDAEYEGPWYAKKHNLPYTMPDLKGKKKKKKSAAPKKDKPSSKPSSSKKGQKKEQSEVLAAIAEKYKKKK